MNATLPLLFRGDLSDVRILPPNPEPRPDTVDLQAMARAALNYLRGNPDPARGYECKFALGPLGIPAHVPISPPNEYGFDVVSLGDTDARMNTQFAHMREMAGDAAGPDPVQDGLRQRLCRYRRADHLCWTNPGACIGETIPGEWVNTWTTAKLLVSLADEVARHGDPALRQETRQMFLALRDLAIWDGSRAYYWGIAPYKDGQWLLRNWCQSHGRNYPWVVEPLVRYYEATGDEEGLALAKAFAEGMLDEVQPEMGAQRVDPATGAFKGHVHLHTHAVWGVAHLGAVLGERRYLDWAAKVHDFVVAQGTDYGWYPEFAPQGEYRTEICVVGDMVSLGANLARGGQPQLWDTVERTVRNELARSQFALTPAFVRLFETLHRDQPAAVVDQALADLRRLEGGFVAQATFDDWVSYPGTPTLGSAGLYANGIQMMGCCPPEGMRGLWEAWNSIVEPGADGVRINLAFSREHEAASVRASRPGDGRLEVTAKRPGRYLIRPPAWSDRDGWGLTRNGAPTPVRWGGPRQAYVVGDHVQPGETLVVTWPVSAFTQSFAARSVPGREPQITTRWVGSQVVGVEPKGQHLPMFADTYAP
jgi:hypothetical protein